MLRALALLLVFALAVGCTPRRRGGGDDDDAGTDDDDFVGPGDDGAYAGTARGSMTSDAIGTQPCVGEVEAEVVDGAATGVMTCALSLQCEGTFADVEVPGTGEMALTGCIGSEAALTLLWNEGTLVGIAEAETESPELGLVTVEFSFDAFRVE